MSASKKAEGSSSHLFSPFSSFSLFSRRSTWGCRATRRATSSCQDEGQETVDHLTSLTRRATFSKWAVFQLYAHFKKQWKEHNFLYAQKQLNACPNVNESEAEQEIGPAQQNWIAAVQLFFSKTLRKEMKAAGKASVSALGGNVSVPLNYFLFYVSLIKRHNCHIYLPRFARHLRVQVYSIKKRISSISNIQCHKILVNEQQSQTRWVSREMEGTFGSSVYKWPHLATWQPLRSFCIFVNVSVFPFTIQKIWEHEHLVGGAALCFRSACGSAKWKESTGHSSKGNFGCVHLSAKKGKHISVFTANIFC